MKIFSKYVLSGFASVLLLYPNYKALKNAQSEIKKHRNNNPAQDAINLAQDWQNVYGDFNKAFNSLTSKSN